MHGATEKLFDAVLVQKGYSDLVEKGRTLKTKNGATVLGGAILKPISSKFSTVSFCVLACAARRRRRRTEELIVSVSFRARFAGGTLALPLHSSSQLHSWSRNRLLLVLQRSSRRPVRLLSPLSLASSHLLTLSLHPTAPPTTVTSLSNPSPNLKLPLTPPPVAAPTPHSEPFLSPSEWFPL